MYVGGDAGVKMQRSTAMQDNKMVFDAESTPEYEEFVEKFKPKKRPTTVILLLLCMMLSKNGHATNTESIKTKLFAHFIRAEIMSIMIIQ